MTRRARVIVAVHGRFHGFDLASGLHRRQRLERLVTTYPAFAVRRFVPSDMPLATVLRLELTRRVAQRLGLGAVADHAVASGFGRFAARHLSSAASIFVGWSGASLEALPRAKAAGMATVIERGSTHIAHQARVLARAYAEEGLPPAVVDPRLIDRELREYAEADAIAVGSNFAARTFVENGISPHKLIVNPYGIDTDRFTPCERRGRTGPVRILFIGAVGVRKGVPLLLRSFSRLRRDAELHLVGPVEAGLWPILQRWGSDRVVVHGAKRGTAVADALRDSDILCLPSVEEGLALGLLQAMASGLPIVATPETGIETVGGENAGITIVPSGQMTALVDALDCLVGDGSTRLEFGRRARQRVAAAFQQDHYVDRAIGAYEGLLAGGRPKA